MSRSPRTLSALSALAAAAAAVTLAPAAAPAAKAPNGQLSAADKMWLQTSISGDLFEIQGGTIAQQQASSQAVKDYGSRLVTDHTKSLKEARALAKAHGVQVPKAPSPSQQWELKTIGALSGAAFDAAYVDLETADHQQDISESTDEVSEGTNLGVRRAAKKDLPTLRRHLKIALGLGGHKVTDPTP
jgi:putative membrane protein